MEIFSKNSSLTFTTTAEASLIISVASAKLQQEFHSGKNKNKIILHKNTKSLIFKKEKNEEKMRWQRGKGEKEAFKEFSDGGIERVATYKKRRNAKDSDKTKREKKQVYNKRNIRCTVSFYLH